MGFFFVFVRFFFLAGELINWAALDREHQPHHTVRVLATDHGHPRLNSTTTVHVTVTDINDNPPQFTHQELNVQVRHV